MVFVTNTTLRARPERVIRIGRLVFAITPRATKAPKRRKPITLADAVPCYLHRDVGLQPRDKARDMPPDLIRRHVM